MAEPTANLQSSPDSRVARAWGSCLQSVFEDLQCSVEHRRQMTLPDVLRCFERRWNTCEIADGMQSVLREQGLDYLRRFYLQHQPFDNGDCWSEPRLRRWIDVTGMRGRGPRGG